VEQPIQADQVPVPDRATSCGLPPPLSYTETSAVLLPLTFPSGTVTAAVPLASVVCECQHPLYPL
jgi:hypothetical protein